MINDLAALLDRPELHYEAILGWLEVQFRRDIPLRHEYHALYLWLIEIVYHILRLRHVQNVGFIDRSLDGLKGISVLASRYQPLWVFSLNHDLIVESLAVKYGIHISCGYGSTTLTPPKRNAAGVQVGTIRGEILAPEELERGMKFLPPGTPGINLFKIHGGLDIFTTNDGRDLVRLLPENDTRPAVLDMLRIVNEELIYKIDEAPGYAKTTNEITYADERGEMQFLRRSRLSGAFKFDNRISQVLPAKILDHFKSSLNHLSKLISIGYGFGDAHINQIIRAWLELSRDRHVEIVAPGMSIPAALLHLTPQVTMVNSGANDYLDAIAGITRTRREQLNRRLGKWFRQQPIKKQANGEFSEFVRQRRDDLVAIAIGKVAELPSVMATSTLTHWV